MNVELGVEWRKEAGWRNDLIKRYDKNVFVSWIPYTKTMLKMNLETLKYEKVPVPGTGRWGVFDSWKRKEKWVYELMYKAEITINDNGDTIYRDIDNRDLRVLAQRDKFKQDLAHPERYNVTDSVDEHNRKIAADHQNNFEKEMKDISDDIHGHIIHDVTVTPNISFKKEEE